MTNIESEAKKKKCQKQMLHNVDLNEESQNRNAGLICVANISSQLVETVWSCMFKKILRLGSGLAEKSVLGTL